MNSNDFKWLVNDIYNSIVIELYYCTDVTQENRGVFDVLDILDTTGDNLNVEFANINDITQLLTMGIIRFHNINNVSDIIDIPIRNFYKLFNNDKLIPLSDFSIFSCFDNSIINNNYSVLVFNVCNISDDLRRIIEIAKDFGNLDMQEKFEALNEVNMINYKRIKNDKKSR